MNIACVTRTFEGAPLPFVLYHGQLAVPCKALGRRMDYARGGARLVQHVVRDWAREFHEGTHWVRLTGEELAHLKTACGLDTESVPTSTPELVLLLEPGIHLVLLKTSRPIGERIRAFLASEVMPELLRTGRYAGKPGEGVASAEEPPPTESVPSVAFALHLHQAPIRPSLAEMRERRLAGQLTLSQRKFEAEWLRETVRLMHAAGRIDDDTRLAYEVAACEIALGEELPELRPVVNERWYSPRQMAELAGVSLSTVGLAISRLGIRGAAGLARQVMAKANGSDRLVHAWVYNDAAFGRILSTLAGEQPPKAA